MDEILLEKIEFVDQNISFFMQKSHDKLNDKENISTALLTILLSDKKLNECRNYEVLVKLIKEYKGFNFYTSFIEVISNLQSYVLKMFNYNIKAEVINKELDKIINLYKINYSFKVKKMA